MHNKSHEGAREFKCEICGKEFNYKAVLKRHIFTHSESKPFKCEQCDKSFHCQSEWKRHQFIHSKDKRTCKSRFLRNLDLNSHISKMTKDRKQMSSNSENEIKKLENDTTTSDFDILINSLKTPLKVS